MTYRDQTESLVARIRDLESEVAGLRATRDAREARDRALASQLDAFGATSVMRVERVLDRALGPLDLGTIVALAGHRLGPAKSSRGGARLRWWWVRDERRAIELVTSNEGDTTRLSFVEKRVGSSSAFNGLTGVSLVVVAVLLVIASGVTGDPSVAFALFLAWLVLAYVAFRARRLAVARVRHRELETILDALVAALR
ncbi:MAG: hypothetical protein J0L92_19340 [Deltaproteobacteria bacterium]|nr:hypothetical protein [Deltaproteobacteria bacterium]